MPTQMEVTLAGSDGWMIDGTYTLPQSVLGGGPSCGVLSVGYWDDLVLTYSRTFTPGNWSLFFAFFMTLSGDRSATPETCYSTRVFQGDSYPLFQIPTAGNPCAFVRVAYPIMGGPAWGYGSIAIPWPIDLSLGWSYDWIPISGMYLAPDLKAKVRSL